MKRNMGNLDRILRTLVALVVLALYGLQVISGAVGLGLVVLSIIFLATSLISFCPLYAPFGINTCELKNKPTN
ncbi:MAG: DUF2892 domain-containing protein [Microscillaceae bacterium]|jgi:hypothetical protein|nr:DUF2892 domain-containing protein [Microscillaceae bacterium]